MSIGKTISFGLIVEVVVFSLFMTFLVALADLFPIAILKTDLVGLLRTWLLIVLLTTPVVYNLRLRRMENAEMNLAADKCTGATEFDRRIAAIVREQYSHGATPEQVAAQVAQTEKTAKEEAPHADDGARMIPD